MISGLDVSTNCTKITVYNQTARATAGDCSIENSRCLTKDILL